MREISNTDATKLKGRKFKSEDKWVDDERNVFELWLTRNENDNVAMAVRNYNNDDIQIYEQSEEEIFPPDRNSVEHNFTKADEAWEREQMVRHFAKLDELSKSENFAEIQLWELLITKIADLPADDNVDFSTDGDMIFCRKETQAEALADLLDQLGGGQVAVTGYYDPAIDEQNGEVNATTGWYYVDIA